MSQSGGMISAWAGQPKFDKLAIVKNQGLADAASDILGSSKTTAAQNASDIAGASKGYLALQPQREADTGEEVKSIGRYFNGDLERSVAGLRLAAMNARRNTAQRSVDYGMATNKLNSLRMGGGDSGYRREMLSKNYGDIMSRADLEDAVQARDDLKYTEGLKQSNLGRRNQLLDATATENLVPMGWRNAEEGRRVGTLGALTSVDEANTMYGASKHRTGLDKWADFSNALGQTIMDAASVYGSVMGAGGGSGLGGGVKTPAGSGANWGSGPS